MFDYTVPTWQELGTACFYAMLFGALLSIGLYLLVWNL